jgi:gluconokinase
LLRSQFETLEEPLDALTIDASMPPERVADELVMRLGP